jgi:hypothetical protein
LDRKTCFYTFQGTTDGCNGGGVISDSAGDLFGWTYGSSDQGQISGTVFELVNSSGSWTFSLLYPFTSFLQPLVGGLALDASGTVYGNAQGAGVPSCIDGCGFVFKIAPSGGQWTYTDLHDFSGDDGANPVGPPAVDSVGNLYGITYDGGNDGPNCQNGDYFGCGVVFEISQ